MNDVDLYEYLALLHKQLLLGSKLPILKRTIVKMSLVFSDPHLLCRENAKGGISAGIATRNWVICANDLEMDLWAEAGNEIKECTFTIQQHGSFLWKATFWIISS